MQLRIHNMDVDVFRRITNVLHQRSKWLKPILCGFRYCCTSSSILLDIVCVLSNIWAVKNALYFEINQSCHATIRDPIYRTSHLIVYWRRLSRLYRLWRCFIARMSFSKVDPATSYRLSLLLCAPLRAIPTITYEYGQTLLNITKLRCASENNLAKLTLDSFSVA